jgi:hypothetical protein
MITDIGDRIPNAKKDEYVDENVRVTIEPKPKGDIVTLKKLWPEPDWVEMYRDGTEKDTLAHIYSIYHSLARKPRDTNRWSFGGVSITVEMWSAAYIETVQFIRDGCDNAVTVSDLEMLKTVFDLYFNNDEGKSTYKTYAAGTGTVKTLFHPLGRSGSAYHYRELLPYLEFPERVEPKKINLFPLKLIHNKTGDESYSLCKVQKRSIKYADQTDAYKNEFPNYKIAVEALIEFHQHEFSKISKDGEDLAPLYIPTKPISMLVTSNDDNLEDVSPDQLMNQFGFRGLQFGNCLSEKERQQFVNNTYEALSLLGDALMIPDGWIGGGRLGMAFAARGRGNAAAHYEPSLNVINLTRRNGAGCIAHEFMHSLDQRLAAKWLRRPNVLLSTEIGANNGYDFKQDIEPEHHKKFDAFLKIYNACCGGNFKQNAVRLGGQKHGRNYWSLSEELIARGFEAYIQDRVTGWGITKQWVAFGTLPSDYSENGMHPYPIGREREFIKQAFDENLRVIFSVDEQDLL